MTRRLQRPAAGLAAMMPDLPALLKRFSLRAGVLAELADSAEAGERGAGFFTAAAAAKKKQNIPKAGRKAV